MSTIHLKTLAHGAINYLTSIYYLSTATGQISEIWHKAMIIPILIPGKDNNIGKNWRHIGLLCPAAKTLEYLLLPKIQTHIPFHPAQHGFRPKHSTCTSQSKITAVIAAGIAWKNPAHRTVLFALDLTSYSTMWTINNCTIVSTYRHQTVAGSFTMCRTDDPKCILGNKNINAERWKHELYKDELCLQRSSITIWPIFQHRLRTSSWSCTSMTLPSTHPVQWWLT